MKLLTELKSNATANRQTLLIAAFVTLTCINVYAQPPARSNVEKATIRVEAKNCPSADGKNRETRVSSGFRFKSVKYEGVITALHGICGCERIVVYNFEEESAEAEVMLVNIDKDIAIINSPEVAKILPNELKIESEYPSQAKLADSEVVVYGHLRGAVDKSDVRLRVMSDPLPILSNVVGSTDLIELNARKSPATAEPVLKMQGNTGPGSSGGPIIHQGRLIAFSDGGLVFGGAPLCWGIPLKDFDSWVFLSKAQLNASKEFKRISSLASNKHFSVNSEILPLPMEKFADEPEKLKIYILPLNPSGDLPIRDIEQTIATAIEKMGNDSLLVKYESRTELAPRNHQQAQRYAEELNADVVIYGKYFSEMFKGGKLSLHYKFARDFRWTLAGMENQEFVGEMSIAFSDEISEIMEEKRAVDLRNVVLLLHGAKHMLRNRTASALQKLEQIDVKNGTPNADIHFLKAVALGHGYKDTFDKSISELNRALEINPRYWNVYRYMISVYTATEGVFSSAEQRKQLLLKLQSVFPDKSIIYFEMGRLYYPASFLGMEYDFDDTPPYDHSKARDLYLKAIKLDPNHVISRITISEIYWELDDPIAALQYLKSAYAIFPPFEQSYASRYTAFKDPYEAGEYNFSHLAGYQESFLKKTASQFLKQEKVPRANIYDTLNAFIDSFNDRIRNAPKNDKGLRMILNNPEAYSTLLASIALHRDGNLRLKHLILEKAQEKDPSNFIPYLIRARIFELEDKNFDAGLDQLKRALNSNPTNGNLFLLTARYIKRNKLGDIQAREMYAKAVLCDINLRNPYNDGYFND